MTRPGAATRSSRFCRHRSACRTAGRRRNGRGCSPLAANAPTPPRSPRRSTRCSCGSTTGCAACWSGPGPIGTTRGCSKPRATSTSSSSSTSWSGSTSTTSRLTGSACWPIPSRATRRAGTGRTGFPSSSTCFTAGTAWCRKGCLGPGGSARLRTCGSTTTRCCNRAWAPRLTRRAAPRPGRSACSTRPTSCCRRSGPASRRAARTSLPATTTTARPWAIPASPGSSRSAATRAWWTACAGSTATWTASSSSSACSPRTWCPGPPCPS